MNILFLTLLTFLTSIIGTVTGFGISTIMVPVVLLFLPLPETLLLVGIIHWFGDVWKMLLFKKALNNKILLYFGLPGVIAAIIGGSLAVNISENLASRFVGCVLIAYVAYMHFKPNFTIKPKPITAILGGGTSGFLGGLTGVGGGALRAIVLTAFNIPKTTYIFTSGILGATIDAGRISSYIISGTKIQTALIFGFILFIPASFLGAEIAKSFIDKLQQKGFRTIIASFLLLLGLKLTFFP